MTREFRYERLIQASPARVFDLFTSPAGQREFYGNDAPGWVVDSRCELRVGGAWEIAFGPSPGELYRHRHVFEAIEPSRHLLLATTETRLDGSSFQTALEFAFEPRDGGTVMTMRQSGLVAVRTSVTSAARDPVHGTSRPSTHRSSDAVLTTSACSASDRPHARA